MAPTYLPVLSASLQQLNHIVLHGVELSPFESAEKVIELSRRELAIHPDSIPLRRITAGAWMRLADIVSSTATPLVGAKPRLWLRVPSEEQCIRTSLLYLDTSDSRKRIAYLISKSRTFVEAYPGRLYRVEDVRGVYGFNIPSLVRCPSSILSTGDGNEFLP